MTRLYEYVIPVRTKSRRAFQAENDHLFLLYHREVRSDGDGWTYKTQTISVASAKVAEFAAAEEIALSPELAEYDVYAILKTVDNPWPERVSVGRARNNDIVLTDPSVSKLHAHFALDTGSKVYLQDADSRNGTTVNDQQVSDGPDSVVTPGDVLRFGRTTFTVLDSGQLYDLVAEHLGSTPDTLFDE